MNRTLRSFPLLLALLVPGASHAQGTLIGAGEVGIGIGNVPRVTGVRINLIDEGVERVDGINLTLWKPRENPDFEMNGLALGVVAPGVGRLRGIGVGGIAVVAQRSIDCARRSTTSHRSFR